MVSAAALRVRVSVRVRELEYGLALGWREVRHLLPFYLVRVRVRGRASVRVDFFGVERCGIYCPFTNRGGLEG